MMQRWFLLLALPLFVSGFARSQEDPAPSEEEKPLTGDVIVLNSGKTISGVQVLRRTPLGYEIEVIKGVAPLFLPRTVVKSITLDDYEPLRERRRLALQPRSQETTGRGTRIAPELTKKLSAELPGMPHNYRNGNLIEIMQDFAERLQVTLKIDDSIRALRPGSIIWNLNVPANKTLMSILNEDFPKKFPQLQIDYDFDVIVLITKEAAQKQSAQQQGQPDS